MAATTRGTSDQRGRWARAGWLVLAVALALAGGACGGPAVPPSGPSGTPLAGDAESAPLPRIGSSFEEPAETETETETEREHGGHGGHGGHAH